MIVWFLSSFFIQQSFLSFFFLISPFPGCHRILFLILFLHSESITEIRNSCSWQYLVIKSLWWQYSCFKEVSLPLFSPLPGGIQSPILVSSTKFLFSRKYPGQYNSQYLGVPPATKPSVPGNSLHAAGAVKGFLPCSFWSSGSQSHLIVEQKYFLAGKS